MHITYRTYPGTAVLELTDEFTYSKKKLVAEALERAKQTGARRIVLNLAQVTFLDSAALGLLALAGQQLGAEQRSLVLVGAQGTVKQLLELSDIAKVLPLFSSEEAAVAAH